MGRLHRADFSPAQPTQEPAFSLRTHHSADTLGLDRPRGGTCWLIMELLHRAGSSGLSAAHVLPVVGLTALF